MQVWFWRNTHDEYNHPKPMSDEQKEAWDGNNAFYCHLVSSKNPMTLGEIVEAAIKYHQEHLEEYVTQHEVLRVLKSLRELAEVGLVKIIVTSK